MRERRAGRWHERACRSVPPDPDDGRCVADHVCCRPAGDLEGDLRYNYHRDMLLLSAEGVHHGHDGVRRLAAILRSYLADAGYEFHKTMTDGDLGMLVWSGRCARDDDYMHEGGDSYVIR